MVRLVEEIQYQLSVLRLYRQLPQDGLVKVKGVAESTDCPLEPSEGCLHERPPPGDCRRVGCPHQRVMRERALSRLRHAVTASRNAGRF